MAEASAQELSFGAFLGDRISDQRHELIARWVAALKEDLAVDIADVLPAEDLLNDFPAVL